MPIRQFKRILIEQLTLRETGINSAYAACGMVDRKPWTYKNDMCVRTLVRTAGDLLGRDFAKEERFQGTRHDALDDCRHQIRYTVKARNAMRAISVKTKSLPGFSMALPVCEAKAAGPDDILKGSSVSESTIPFQHSTTSPDVSGGLGIETVVNETNHVPVSVAHRTKCAERVSDPQELFPRTDARLSPSPKIIIKLQKESQASVEAEEEADLDSLVQAAYETYVEEWTSKASHDIVVLPSPVRDSLGDRSEVGGEECCEQYAEDTSALDLAAQLEKLNVV